MSDGALRMKEWAVLGWTWLRGRVKGMTLRRGSAIVVALLLWMGAGGMEGSAAAGRDIPPAGDAFGEIHWYEGP